MEITFGNRFYRLHVSESRICAKPTPNAHIAFGGLKICNCRLFAEKTVFAAMSARVLALRRCLPVVLRYVSAQSQ